MNICPFIIKLWRYILLYLRWTSLQTLTIFRIRGWLAVSLNCLWAIDDCWLNESWRDMHYFVLIKGNLIGSIAGIKWALRRRQTNVFSVVILDVFLISEVVVKLLVCSFITVFWFDNAVLDCFGDQITITFTSILSNMFWDEPILLFLIGFFICLIKV